MKTFDASISSTAIPITQDSRLLVDIWTTSTVALDLFLKILSLGQENQIIESVETFTADISAFPTQREIILTDDRLISVAIWTGAVDAPFGSIFSRIALKQTDVPSNDRTTVLTSGYLTGGNVLNYPTSQPRSSLEGIGSAVANIPANPAAGSEIQVNYSPERYTRILGGLFILTTSAAVANRTVTLDFWTDGGEVFRTISRTVQAAGVARNYWLWPGPNLPADAGANIYLPISPMIEGSGMLVVTSTTNIDVADQFSNVKISRQHLIIPA